MKTISIRDARPDELPLLYELNQAHLPHLGALTPGELTCLFEQAAYCRVVEVEEGIAGFLIALEPGADYGSPNFLWFRERYETFVYIDRIAVAAAARRRGIASLLYGDLEAFARRRNIPLMTCEYNLVPENTESRIFHRCYGFSEAGRQQTEEGRKLVSLQCKEVK